jgi:hypothetical protein
MTNTNAKKYQQHSGWTEKNTFQMRTRRRPGQGPLLERVRDNNSINGMTNKETDFFSLLELSDDRCLGCSGSTKQVSSNIRRETFFWHIQAKKKYTYTWQCVRAYLSDEKGRSPEWWNWLLLALDDLVKAQEIQLTSVLFRQG